ncbi:MAG: histidine--tRNA ligase [Thermoflavifilum sp.]|nr:histidine--tRNA ligase [Thermoflavifilum sp.]
MIKPALPKGTRDFAPEAVRKRRYLFQTIQQCFEAFGFEPIETPAMENLSTLLGKYGEEGDKLIFRILNNGDILPLAQRARDSRELANLLAEKALRYDLTIPFARFVVMNQHQLVFPFRRYQIQPVWRADRPQKGRYREFYQCDADIVGSRSLFNEVELIGLYQEVFSRLQLRVRIRINHRKWLLALAETCGNAAWLTPITTAIDKIDKVGVEQVESELREKGFPTEAITLIRGYLELPNTPAEAFPAVLQLLRHHPAATDAVQDVEFILKHLSQNEPERATVQIDFTLARGLDYYTGTILEVNSEEVAMGSLGGGGRYDNLTGLFGLPDVPGVGISFGVDRIFDVMESLHRFPATTHRSTQMLWLRIDDMLMPQILEYVRQFRNQGISTEVYPDAAKIDKQLKYADRKGIPFAILLGSREYAAQVIGLKDLRHGTQEQVPLSQVMQVIRQKLQEPER